MNRSVRASFSLLALTVPRLTMTCRWQGLQVGGPAVESYYPTVPPTTYPSEEIPMQGLGASDPIYAGSEDLSWNERRKIDNYAKRVEKDNRRKAKDEAKVKQDVEKRAAIEERKRLK